MHHCRVDFQKPLKNSGYIQHDSYNNLLTEAKTQISFFTSISKRIVVHSRYGWESFYNSFHFPKSIKICFAEESTTLPPMLTGNRCAMLRLNKGALNKVKIYSTRFIECTNNDVSAAFTIFPRIAVRKIPLTHLCVLGADVDRRNVIDDVLDSPTIHGLPVAARYVAIESRTPDWRRCGWSRGRFRLGGHAFGSPCFRPLSLARCEATGTRKVQRTRHPRVSFVRAYVSR